MCPGSLRVSALSLGAYRTKATAPRLTFAGLNAPEPPAVSFMTAER